MHEWHFQVLLSMDLPFNIDLWAPHPKLLPPICCWFPSSAKPNQSLKRSTFGLSCWPESNSMDIPTFALHVSCVYFCACSTTGDPKRRWSSLWGPFRNRRQKGDYAKRAHPFSYAMDAPKVKSPNGHAQWLGPSPAHPLGAFETPNGNCSGIPIGSVSFLS